jgi:hypothetical protein
MIAVKGIKEEALDAYHRDVAKALRLLGADLTLNLKKEFGGEIVELRLSTGMRLRPVAGYKTKREELEGKA